MSSLDRRNRVSQVLRTYTTNFPPGCGAAISNDRTGDVVLITGTTGSLGCYLLASLLSTPDVRRVYALNRPSRDDLRDRQRAALVDRGLDEGILKSPKLVLLVGDTAKPLWDLTSELYGELHGSVTHIIHNAWPVDFLSPLSVYEPTIRGLRNLIDFAITSPLHTTPRLLFASSVVVLQSAPYNGVIPEAPSDLKYVIPNGYSEAKWVSEQVLYTAAAQTRLNPLVVRIGQLCGGQSGAWSTHEWFPAMVQGATALGYFPSDPRCVDWLSFEAAAAAVVEMRRASSPTFTMHLVNPVRLPWPTIARVLSCELELELVSFGGWIDKLEAAAGETGRKRLRAAKLVPFFRSLAAMPQSGLAMGHPEVSVELAVQASPTLAHSDSTRISEADVLRWLSYWRNIGFIRDAYRVKL